MMKRVKVAKASKVTQVAGKGLLATLVAGLLFAGLGEMGVGVVAGEALAVPSYRPVISFGADVVRGGGDGGVVGSHVYFGAYDWSEDDIVNPDAMQWRVLSSSNDSDTSMAGKQDALFMMTEYVYDSGLGEESTGAPPRPLTTVGYGKHRFDSKSALWQGCELQTWLTNDFLSAAFSATETDNIAATTKAEVKPDYGNENEYSHVSTVDLMAEKVFVPSGIELMDIYYGFNGKMWGVGANRIAYLIEQRSLIEAGEFSQANRAAYWTRNSIYTGSSENFMSSLVTTMLGVRPALNLDKDNILFTSSAVGGKSMQLVDGTSVSWPTITTTSDEDWKFTLLDDVNQHLSIVDAQRVGDVVTLVYKNATTGINQHICALITDAEGSTINNYAPLADLSSGDAACGTLTFTLPAGYDDSGSVLKVFSEQSNGDYLTDYASTPQAVFPSSAASILSFEMPGQLGEAVIDESAASVAVSLPANSDVTALMPTFTASSGAGVEVAGVAQTSGVTSNDFSNAVTYVLTAPDGTSRDWTVTVTRGGSAEKRLLTFAVGDYVGEVNEAAHTVHVTLPYGSQVKSLTPQVTLSAGATLAPAQGTADFSASVTTPVIYTVRAQDGTTQDYAVTVEVTPASRAKELLSFEVAGASSAIAENTVEVVFPYATAASAYTSVKPEISVSSLARVTPRSGETVDLSTPVTYTVTAQDGSTQDWVVTARNALNTQKDITSFVIDDNAGLIDTQAHTVTVTMPLDTVETRFTPTIAVSPDATISPKSGVLRNFAAPVTYTVTAQDGSVQDWTITVKAAQAAADKALLSFAINGRDATIDEATHSVQLELPYGTQLDSLAASFTVSDNAILLLDGVRQFNGATQNDYRRARRFTVRAQDGSEQIYTVNVTAVQNSWKQLAGNTRYDTMSVIVDEAFGAQASDTLILATGDNFPDALAASSLAGLSQGAILLSSSDELSWQARLQIEQNNPTTVYLIGGVGALSPNVEREVKEILGYQPDVVKRLSGETRYETCLAVYEEGARSAQGWSKTAIVCSGSDYADALAIAPYAYASGSPIFLVQADGVLDIPTVRAINQGDFENVLLVGGTGVVSDTLMTQLGGKYNYQRLGGSDRYQTSLRVAEWCTGEATGVFSPSEATTLSYNRIALATGADFPDALAGSVLCGRLGSALLLVDDNPTGLAAVNEGIKVHADVIEKGYFLGGDGVISPALQDKVKAANTL